MGEDVDIDQGDRSAAVVVPEGPVVASWQLAEALAAWHMKTLGFDDAGLTSAGADGGIDVVASGAVAQVKHHASSPIGAPAVQQLRGAAVGQDWALFYALSGYTRSAVEFADKANVALFVYDSDGSVDANSSIAEHLQRRAGQEGAPDVSEFEIEQEAKRLSQEYFDMACTEFFGVAREALALAAVAPGSRVHRAVQVETPRVQEVVEYVGAATLPISEFTLQVERITEATDRLRSDVDHARRS